MGGARARHYRRNRKPASSCSGRALVRSDLRPYGLGIPKSEHLSHVHKSVGNTDSVYNSPARTRTRSNLKILVARLVIAVAFLDLFVQFPIIAPFAREVGATPALAGLIVAAYSLTNLFGNVVAGVFLDRWGRILPLQAGMLLTSVALFGYVVADSPMQLLLARAFHGLSAAILAPGAFALIGDLSSSANRVRVMGRSSASIALAAVVGPMSAGLISSAAGYRAPFLLTATLMLLVFLVFSLSPKSTWQARSDNAIDSPKEQEPRRANYALLIMSYAAALAMTVGTGALVAFLPPWLLAQDQQEYLIGMLFALFSAVGMGVMASPLVSLPMLKGRWISLAAGLSLIGLGLGALGAIPNMLGSIIGMTLFGCGFGLTYPRLISIVVDATSEAYRGRALGVFYAVYSLGVAIGSLSSGLLEVGLGSSSPAPFFMGVLMIALALPFTYVVDSIGRKRTGAKEVPN